MHTYDGIRPEGLLLLAQNRFENSKEFYEAHKEEIKRLVLTPLGQIVEALAGDFARLDPQMLLAPARVVSRVRRDTRFAKEKHLYRENVWITFSRKGEGPMVWPCMWFEVLPEESAWVAGVCVYDNQPAYMQFLRARIAEAPQAFLQVAQGALDAGAALQTEAFKKDRAGDAPDALKPYLNAKGWWLKHRSSDLTPLAREDFPETLRGIYAAYAPMYRYLLAAAQAHIGIEG